MLTLVGCEESHSGNPRLFTAFERQVHANCGDATDVLFVVDDGVSMAEEQERVAPGISAIAQELVLPGDENGDGAPDFPAKRDLHVGVVTSTGDGSLRIAPAAPEPSCEARFPPYLSWHADEPDPQIIDDLGCLARVGAVARGSSHPFESALDALTERSLPGGPNEGFLRPASLLAIFVITDRDDASADDANDVVREILALREGHAERVVLAAVAGVAPDLVSLSSTDLLGDDIQSEADYEAILDDPSMQGTVACETPGEALASPSRRVVEVVRDVDRESQNGLVQSICQEDWTPLARTITRLIAADGYQPCLSRPLVGEDFLPLETGAHAPCVLRETRIDDGPCGLGRVEIGTDDGKTICHVCQRGDGEAPHEEDLDGHDVSACAGSTSGWFYSTESSECGGVGKIELEGELTCASGTLEGSWLTLSCAMSVDAD